MSTKMKCVRMAVCAVALMVVANVALATSIPVPNFSFESGTDNWTLINGVGAFGSYEYTPAATNGTKYALLSSDGIYQFVGTVAAGTYTLTVDVAEIYGDIASFPSYRWIGIGAPYPGYPNYFYPTAQIENSDIAPLTGGSWALNKTVTLDVPVGSSLIGRQLRIAMCSGGPYMGFDNVRLDYTAIPEPATMAVLGLGGLLMRLRRRSA